MALALVKEPDFDFDSLQDTRRRVLEEFLRENARQTLNRLTDLAHVMYQLRKLGASEEELMNRVGEDMYLLLNPISRLDDEE